MAESVCTRTSAQSPDTIFDKWADEGAAARADAAHIPSCPVPLQRVHLPSTDAERERRARVLYRGVAGLLDAASITDEDHDQFHESDRFLYAAFEFAEARADGAHDLSALTNDAFTVAALLKGARSVPGDTESTARRSHIDAAGALLFQIIGPEEGEIDGLIDAYPCHCHAAQEAA